MPKWGYFGAKKKVCPLETSIQILFMTDLLIQADGQIKLYIFRHRNFAIWSISTRERQIRHAGTATSTKYPK